MKGRGLLLGLVMAACSCGVAAQGSVCQNATVADIVFLVDGSGSISDENFKEVKSFVRDVITALDIGRNKVSVGLAQYSNEPNSEFLLKDHTDKTSLLAAVDRLTLKGGGTETGKALDFLLKQHFTKQAGSRASQQVPQIAVVITDGDSADDVKVPAQKLRQRGVIVFGIGVGQVKKEQLQDIANRPSERFLSIIDNFQALRILTEHLLQTVCSSVETQTHALKEKVTDVFFLVDSAIGPGQFSIMRAELIKLLNNISVGASYNRIGLAQYGEDVAVDFRLNTFKTKAETLDRVEKFRLRPKRGKPRNLGRALEFAHANLFTSEAGGRAHLGSEQLLVLVIGKESDDIVDNGERLIKSAGIKIAAMNAGAPMSIIVKLADSQMAFPDPILSALSDIIEGRLQEKTTEDCKAANVADIAFIVDESGSIGVQNFQLVRNFLRSIVSGLEVGPNRVRVSIVTYNDRPTAQFHLNEFSDKSDMLQFISILPYRGGGTRTGAALDFTRREVFVKKSGSRKNIQQVAVVVTDGKSDDSVSNAAIRLRRSGVTIYAVGIKDANETELMEMASHDPDKHVFNLHSFSGLTSLKLTLQRTLCTDIFQSAVIDSSANEDIKQACERKDEADIFFLIDDSGSINYDDFEDMKNFVIEFIKSFRIGPQHVRMGLVKYQTTVTLEFDLTTYSDANNLEKAVKRITHEGGGTNTGAALSSMVRYFNKAAASRVHEVPEYLIVITDGASQDQVTAPAEQLRAQRVITYAIGIKGANKTELQQIAGDPKKTFSLDNFDALKFIKSDVLRDICTPDACQHKQSDIFFLADSSGSIQPHEYQIMKNFLKSVINKTAVGQNDVHVGIMQFCSKPTLEFRLNQYFSKDEIFRVIDNMHQTGGGTNTGKALTEVSAYFDASQGGRPSLKQVLVVITDGEAQDDVKGPADDLRHKGVDVYAIGVERGNYTQLVEISGSTDRVFKEAKFDELKDLDSQVVLKLCSGCKKTDKADIIFLVDVSTSIDDTQFKSMQSFMASVVNQTTVGKDLTHFGVITYATVSKSVFTLTQYFSRQELFNAIEQVQQTGGSTYTGQALNDTLKFFDSDHGGRKAQKVPQILMVITDGAASDRDKLKAPSDELRKNGVVVVSIGVKDARREELNIMAGGDTTKVFYVDNFDALRTLYKTISSVLDCNIKPACKKEKADLVVLLDESGSISRLSYSMMINFTVDLVKSFTVTEELVHVGVAQFSDDPRHEFYLNEYTNVEEMVTHIRSMEHRGGATYIGKALSYIQSYFTASRGARSGISKNLLLITDGDSHDDVEDAADSLKSLGVEVFAVGVGDVHNLELLQITGTPEALFSVQNYDGLANVKKDIVDAICTTEPESACSIDIAMGFDISRARAPDEVLMSGHTKLRTFLPEIVSYVSSVRGLCCVSPRAITPNITLRVVHREGHVLDHTDFEGYSEDKVKNFMTRRTTEATYFNTAMLNSFRESFRLSDADVKVLVIFSDGLDEDVEKLEQESERLRQSGVSALLTVALEGVRDTARLQMVEFGRGFGYKLPLSIGMPSVGSTVLKQISSVSDRDCCCVMCKCSGHEGTRGSWGHRGSKGGVGQKGQTGFMGEEGVTGERGPPGPSGPRGLEGCPGVRGQKASRGIAGDRGETGEDGLDGVDGEVGLTGLDGSGGDRGNPGNPGIPGIRGEAGPKGERGLRGDPGEPGADDVIPGPEGEPGNPGLPGEPGEDGLPGESGTRGSPGQDGRRGPDGEKAAPGQPGVRGLPGSPGAAGPQGRRGENGEPGPRGVSGFPGRQGEPGAAGAPGPAGRHGANGQKGQPGDPGVKGAPGSLGPRGTPGDDGKDGYGPPGPTGVKGDPGFPGYPGLPGEDGLQGTKGYPGHKGNRGRTGNSGISGEPGMPGDPGGVGHRGKKGPPGGRDKTECELITSIRENCACSRGRSECPAYPTELVFGLDMSGNVTEAAFERQLSALRSLLDDITISESNCPTGARVAVVSYTNYTSYLIRFHDYHLKKELIQSVKNITLKASNSRKLGAAMRFVGHNVFKRVRAGIMMRKVAIFFSGGETQDTSDIVTAMMEYRALDIVPAVISLRKAPPVARALEVDDSGKSIFTVLSRDMAANLGKIKDCVICYDPCKRSEQCAFIQEVVQPQEANLDLVMVVDSSREMQADEYAGVQQMLGSVVEQLAVSPQPRRSGNQARVAVVQQSGTRVTKPEFGLQTYQNHDLMRRHLIQNMRQQGGSSALGQTLEFSLKEVLLKATQPRRKRALLTVVGTQTAYEDRAKLHYISQKAKCEGVAVFVVTVGDRYNRTQVEELASKPVQQHLIHVGRLRPDEQAYAQRFFRVFITALNKGMNPYPPPPLKQRCDQLAGQEEGQIFISGQGPTGVVEEFAEEVEEKFEEHTGGQTQTGQLDIIETLSRGDGQGFVSRAQLDAQCQLESDTGIQCGDYVQLWFFDKDIGACAPFWYGGCGGNANRFNTENECLRKCGSHNPDIMPKPELANFIPKDACFLSQDQGSCQNYTMMWFFDTEQNECSRFWFGGCGGNGNRFKTQEECENLCLTKSR